MRPRRASASNGIVNRRVRFSHQTVLFAAMAVVGLWMALSFVQEVALNQSLNRQAAQVQAQNASLAAANDGYRQDMKAVSSGAAAEEEARKDGYARPDETLYVIATPPAPTPPPAKPAGSGAGGPLAAIWRFITSTSAS